MHNEVYRVVGETYHGPYIGTIGGCIGEDYSSFEEAVNYIKELANRYGVEIKLYEDHPCSAWAVNNKVWVSGYDTFYITKHTRN